MLIFEFISFLNDRTQNLKDKCRKSYFLYGLFIELAVNILIFIYQHLYYFCLKIIRLFLTELIQELKLRIEIVDKGYHFYIFQLSALLYEFVFCLILFRSALVLLAIRLFCIFIQLFQVRSHFKGLILNRPILYDSSSYY